MSRRLRPHYRSDLGWILGVAFDCTLTRSDWPAQGFTFVRCCGSPRASSPHGLAAPGPASLDGVRCVQLPLARGCYQLAPRRTFTFNPMPMPGTQSFRRGATQSARSGSRFAQRANPPHSTLPPPPAPPWTEVTAWWSARGSMSRPDSALRWIPACAGMTVKNAERSGQGWSAEGRP